jgi:predicted permease
VRFALRSLLRVPALLCLTVMTVALAIGVNAGTLPVVTTALYTSLGVPEPDRLAYYSIGDGVHTTPLSGPLYEALRYSSPFGELAIWNSSVNLFLQTPDGATRLNGSLVNGEFFSIMRIIPLRGRFFDSGDDQPGGGENGWAAVISYNLWHVRFGADPNIIGKVAVINGTPVHVVGILPKNFTGLNPPAATEVLLPRHFLDVLSPGQDRFSKNWYMEWDVYGRVPRGTTLEKLQAALKTVDRQVREATDPSGQMFTKENFPGTGNGRLLSAASGQLGHSYRLQAVRQPLLAMLILAVVLFLFCVCNLVLLLVGRGTRTAHQTLIRVAFGATYRHILVTAALEGVILVLMGSVAGVPLAWIVSHGLSALMRSRDGFESFPMVSPGFPLLMLGAVVMLLVAVIVTTRTAFRHAKLKDHAILNTATRMVTARSHPWIVGCEVVAATFFLTFTGVGVAVFGHLFHQASGFDTSSVVASLGLINTGGTPEKLVPERLDRIVQIIGHSPGVLAVATTNLLPLSGAYARTTFAARLNGGVVRKQDGMWPAAVSAEYFAATGTRILQGRSFVSDDRADDPVCEISVSAAKALFGSEGALGKYVYANENDARANSPKPYCRVIGVAEDAHLKSMTEPPSQAVYLLSNERSPNIVVRAATSTLAAQAIRNAVQAVAPSSLDSGIDSLQTRMDDDTRFVRALTFFDALCAGFAVLMMAIGLFGVISLEVASHRREIGVQMAMGARRLNVSKAVLKGFFKPVFNGVVIGSALTWIAVTRLREIAPIETMPAVEAYLAGCMLIILVMSGAVSAPIRRALRISPAECLRSE